MEKRLWTHDEMVLALALYFQLPFGRLNHTTPEVQELGRLIGRTENSAALRLVNYAACDPYIRATGRHGMESGSKVCLPYWNEYANDRERLFAEAAEIRARLQGKSIEEQLPGEVQKELQDYTGKAREAIVKVRVNQHKFREMILNNYNETCAISGINDSRLLIASHIIPWSEREDTRLDPENGICLSALYDKAFDKGLITIRPDDYTIMLSPQLKDGLTKEVFNEHFGIVENKRIILPEEHRPKNIFLQYHVERVFVK